MIGAGLLATVLFLTGAPPDPSISLAEELVAHLDAEVVPCQPELASFGTTLDAICTAPGLETKPLRKAIKSFLRKRPEVTTLPASGRFAQEHLRIQRFFVERELFRVVHDIETGTVALMPHQSCFHQSLLGTGLARAWTPGVTPPEPVEQVHPSHPAAARNARQDGFVMVQAMVAADGSVAQTCALYVAPEGFGFREAAMNAVRAFRYEPALTDGEPTAFLLNVSIVFQ